MENERIFSLAERTMLKYHPSMSSQTFRMKHNILSPQDYHLRSKEWPSDAILLPKSTKAPFLSRILHLSPPQGHCSLFLKVRTTRDVPLSLSFPYRAGVKAKESIWCSAVPGSCGHAPGGRGRRQSTPTALAFLVRSTGEIRGKATKASVRPGYAGKGNRQRFCVFFCLCRL